MKSTEAEIDRRLAADHVGHRPVDELADAERRRRTTSGSSASRRSRRRGRRRSSAAPADTCRSRTARRRRAGRGRSRFWRNSRAWDVSSGLFVGGRPESVRRRRLDKPLFAALQHQPGECFCMSRPSVSSARWQHCNPDAPAGRQQVHFDAMKWKTCQCFSSPIAVRPGSPPRRRGASVARTDAPALGPPYENSSSGRYASRPCRRRTARSGCRPASGLRRSSPRPR